MVQTTPEKCRKRIYTPGRQLCDQLLVGLLLLLPYLGLCVLRHLAEPYAPRPLVFLVYAGAVLAYAVLLIFVSYAILPFAVSRRLRPKLVAKVAAVYGQQDHDAPMVGYSPGSEMQRFGMVSHKDFGLLIFKPDVLTYCGDTMTFGLAPQQVEEATVVEQSFWGIKVPRLLIGWRQDPDQPLQGFTLEAWDASTLWQSRAAAQNLFQRIERWRGSA